MTTIPAGFASVTPYIIFDDSAAAIAFYKRALGAETVLALDNPKGGIMYAEIQLGNSRIMLGDANPEWGGQSATTLGGSPVSLYLYVDNTDQACQQAERAGMTVKMPAEDMFWGDRIAALTDPFGIQWTLAQHIKDVSPEEMQQLAKNMTC
jgi:uncharacterized glyoxalase superfamily protein PhnB